MSRTMALARGGSASGATTGPGGGAGGMGTVGILSATATRRWTPSHGIGNSVGKIEEKLRQMNTGDSEASVKSSAAPMSPTWSRSTVGSAAAAGVMSASNTGLSDSTEGEGSPSMVVSPRIPRYRLWDQPIPSSTSSPTQSPSSLSQEGGHPSPKAVVSSPPVVHKRHTLPSFFPPPSLPSESMTTASPPQRSPSPTRRAAATFTPPSVERDAALPPRSPLPPTRTYTPLTRSSSATPGLVKLLSGLASPWAETQQPTSTPTPE
ncbi:hypothetical protein FRC04_009308 [Tulasnella sp. 424]|nr:hypothetical protein FRC04_009308 [Tulasnella sp. 424]